MLSVMFNAIKWPESRKRSLAIVYYVWGFVWPLIMTIIIAAVGQLGNQATGLPYCFIINENRYTNDGNAWIQCVLIDNPASVAQNSQNSSVPITQCTVQPQSNVGDIL